MTKDESLTLESVSIEFNETELALLTNILNIFFYQSDEVLKFAGVKSEEDEVVLSNLLARMDNVFQNSFNEDHILREMWGESLDKP